MKGDEGRVEKREREDDQKILKIRTFHEHSSLPSSPLFSLLPPPFQTYPNEHILCPQYNIRELPTLYIFPHLFNFFTFYILRVDLIQFEAQVNNFKLDFLYI